MTPQCQTCGRPARWIPESGVWGCDACRHVVHAQMPAAVPAPAASKMGIWIAIVVGLAAVGGVVAVVLLTGDDDKKSATPPVASKDRPPTDDDEEDTVENEAPKPPDVPAPSSWGVVWVHPQKLISIRFPRTPTETEESTDSAIGKVKFTIAMHDGGDRGYMATAAVYDTLEGQPFDLEAALDGGRDQMLANIGARVLSEKKISLDGYQGREISFEGSVQGQTLRGTARLFASATPPSSYIASAFRISSSPDPDANKFLDSMHIGAAIEK